MTSLRAVGLVVLIFFVFFPVAYVMHDGLPAHETLSQDDEDKDDPVVDAYCLKAFVEMSNGKLDKAIEAYTQAIGRDPKYSFAYLGRGDVYLAKGDLDRALLDYDRALRLDPTNDAAKARAEAVREEKAKP
jgi:tetratricopeptide (TPR) repeat protein